MHSSRNRRIVHSSASRLLDAVLQRTGVRPGGARRDVLCSSARGGCHYPGTGLSTVREKPSHRSSVERPEVRSAMSAAARGAADLVVDASFEVSGSSVLLPVAEW